MRPVSYRPKYPATADPAIMPMTGAQSRGTPVALSAMPPTTSRVASALSGAATAGTPSGTSLSMSKTIGITVTGMSMMTVPATVGVRIRRSIDNRAENTNWKIDEMRISVASIAGPPSAIAVTQIAMNAPDVPMART